MQNQNVIHTAKTAFEGRLKTHEIHSYTKEELENLKEFVKFIQNDKERATLACWGDHSEYSRGY